METCLHAAVSRFGLTDVKTVLITDDRAVAYAQSEEYGFVVLKLDTDYRQLENEYTMLEECDGRGACRVFDFAVLPKQQTGKRRVSCGAMLLERILPGTSLRREASLDRRMEIFCRVFRQIHQGGFIGCEYLQWLDDMVKYCQMYCPGTQLEQMALKAFSICADIYAAYPESIQLHGDLHHDNILLTRDGEYKIIDPKAVTGPAILDIPRFLYNEIPMAMEDREAHIRSCIRKAGEILGYPVRDICRLFYMETVLANLWLLEDGLPMRPEELALAEIIVS